MNIRISRKRFHVVANEDWSPEARAFEAFVAHEEERRKTPREVFEEATKTFDASHDGPSMLYHEMNIDRGWITFELRIDSRDYSKHVSCMTVREIHGGAK